MIDYGDWTLNHPVKATLILVACLAAGGALGVLAAYITADWRHLLSRDNVPAGLGMGFGGACLGGAAAWWILSRMRHR